MNEKPASDSKKPNFFQIIGSVLSAIFGVQNNKNRERDFTQGNIKYFIGVYAIIVLCIILSMVTLVRFVISHAAS